MRSSGMSPRGNERATRMDVKECALQGLTVRGTAGDRGRGEDSKE